MGGGSMKLKLNAANYRRGYTLPERLRQRLSNLFLSKLPGREVHLSPTPDFILHQVLPFTTSPNTSKEVFLYSPGRSVNWPAASKAEKLTLKGLLVWQDGG